MMTGVRYDSVVPPPPFRCGVGGGGPPPLAVHPPPLPKKHLLQLRSSSSSQKNNSRFQHAGLEVVGGMTPGKPPTATGWSVPSQSLGNIYYLPAARVNNGGNNSSVLRRCFSDSELEPPFSSNASSGNGSSSFQDPFPASSGNGSSSFLASSGNGSSFQHPAGPSGYGSISGIQASLKAFREGAKRERSSSVECAFPAPQLGASPPPGLVLMEHWSGRPSEWCVPSGPGGLSSGAFQAVREAKRGSVECAAMPTFYNDHTTQSPDVLSASQVSNGAFQALRDAKRRSTECCAMPTFYKDGDGGGFRDGSSSKGAAGWAGGADHPDTLSASLSASQVSNGAFQALRDAKRRSTECCAMPTFYKDGDGGGGFYARDANSPADGVGADSPGDERRGEDNPAALQYLARKKQIFRPTLETITEARPRRR